MPASNDRWRLPNPLNEADRSAADRDPQEVGNSTPPPTPPPTPLPWQPRFGLRSVMLILLVSAVAAAGGRLLIQGLQTNTGSRAVFVIFVLVVPVTLLILLNFVRLALQYWRRRK